jgi:hypothetical protein
MHKELGDKAILDKLGRDRIVLKKLIDTQESLNPSSANSNYKLKLI